MKTAIGFKRGKGRGWEAKGNPVDAMGAKKITAEKPKRASSPYRALPRQAKVGAAGSYKVLLTCKRRGRGNVGSAWQAAGRGERRQKG